MHVYWLRGLSSSVQCSLTVGKLNLNQGRGLPAGTPRDVPYLSLHKVNKPTRFLAGEEIASL